MIQVNLLPDVKAQYVSAQRTKRTVISISVIVSLAAISIVVILSLVAFGAQKLNLSQLQDDIDETSKDIKSVEDLDKILTVQNQLNKVPGLHETKPVNSRLFGYLQSVIPTSIKIDNFSLNHDEQSLKIEGNTVSIDEVNKFVDTLIFTEYKLKDNDEPQKAFKEVVLSEFKTSSKETTYTISFKFDPNLFDSKQELTLQVPQKTTTRSIVEAPLFKQNIEIKPEGEE